MSAVALAILLAVAPVQGADAVPRDPEGGCRQHASYRVPPTRLSVFRIHRRGSAVPARVERWLFRDYVAAVAESGAWPAGKPMESLKVGVIAIKQYAWWQVMHTCRAFRGRTFAITDSEQFLSRGMRPGHRAHSRIRRAIDATWDVSLRKRGRFFRTGWSGGHIEDGWHLGEDTVTALARRGWHWRRIVSRLLHPVEIVESTR